VFRLASFLHPHNKLIPVFAGDVPDFLDVLKNTATITVAMLSNFNAKQPNVTLNHLVNSHVVRRCDDRPGAGHERESQGA
jgi:hypothetical protein